MAAPRASGSSTGRSHSELPRFTFSSCIKRPTEKRSQIYSLEFFPSAETNIFASCGGRRVTLLKIHDAWDADGSETKTAGRLEVIRGFRDEDEKEDFYCSTWTLDRETGKPVLCVAGEAGVIKFLDVENSLLKLYLMGHGGPVYDLCLHPLDSDLLFSCSKDESIRLWSIHARRCLVVFAGDQGHRDSVLSLDVHCSGLWLASSGMDNTVKIWELDSDAVKQAISTGQQVEVPHSAQWTENGDNGKSRKFRAPFIQFPAFSTRRVHTDYVDCVRWMGDLLISKSIESKCLMWKPDMRRRANSVSMLREYPYSSGKLWYVRFGLNSRLTSMAIGADDGGVFLFDIDAGGSPYQQITHPQMRSVVRSTRFSPDDAYLVSCCDDGTLWCFRRS